MAHNPARRKSLSAEVTHGKRHRHRSGIETSQTADGGRVQSVRLLYQLINETISAWITVGITFSLIFGGCCSNVYALEAIVKVEPGSGTLLTFVQFLFVAVTGYVSQFDSTRPPFFVAKNVVPISRWLVSIVLFFTINVMNNHAFSYDISVPVHIILRSGGPITTITAGFLYGKKYSRTQVIAALLMTVGVAIAAWSDAQSKHVEADIHSEKKPFGIGVLILFLAMALSSCMGLYTEEIYRKYGPQWRENLFYSHILSLPLFLPFSGSLVRQFVKLSQSPPLKLPIGAVDALRLAPGIKEDLTGVLPIPSQLAYLGLNVLTQYACIRGVNLLAAVSSALTVVIVLNIRKLVSLLLSIWLFGNELSVGTLIGALVVFGAGGLYSLGGDSSRKKQKAS